MRVEIDMVTHYAYLFDRCVEVDCMRSPVHDERQAQIENAVTGLTDL